MKFYKYHGAGNDFVLIDNRNGEIPEDKKALLAKMACDRGGEIGADGLLIIEASDAADAKMRIFNPDGSEPAMCGNGIRCAAKYIHDKIQDLSEIKIETLAGIKSVVLSKIEGVTYVRVNMGRPLFERRDIPATGEGRLFEERIEAGGRKLKIYAVNTGVPHAVVFVDDIRKAEVENIGRAVRNHPLFPDGTNVNFVEIVCANLFKVRTYERGVEGETLACGTGITAVGVVCVMLGEADSDDSIEIIAKGDTVYVEVDLKGKEIERTYMKGPAEFVFEGEIDV